jgi:hypothetical protein
VNIGSRQLSRTPVIPLPFLTQVVNPSPFYLRHPLLLLKRNLHGPHIATSPAIPTIPFPSAHSHQVSLCTTTFELYTVSVSLPTYFPPPSLQSLTHLPLLTGRSDWIPWSGQLGSTRLALDPISHIYDPLILARPSIFVSSQLTSTA